MTNELQYIASETYLDVTKILNNREIKTSNLNITILK